MVKMTDMTYDQKLITLCERRGWDQAALWRAVGRVSKTTVSNWWNGVSRPDMDTALVVARALGVPLDYLADDSQDDLPEPEAQLSQDEELALGFYRDMREHEGSATVVLKVLALMAKQGVSTRPVPARQPAGPAVVYGVQAPVRGRGGVATAEGDSGAEELPGPGPMPVRVLAERDETEHHLRLERERRAREREAAREKAKKKPKGR